MRGIYEVLREKEDAIESVRREVKAPRLIIPLLADAQTSIPQPVVPTEARTETGNQQLGEALRTVAPLLVDETEDFDPEVRARLIEAAESDSKLGRAQRMSRQLRHIPAPLLGANLGQFAFRTVALFNPSTGRQLKTKFSLSIRRGGR